MTVRCRQVNTNTSLTMERLAGKGTSSMLFSSFSDRNPLSTFVFLALSRQTGFRLIHSFQGDIHHLFETLDMLQCSIDSTYSISFPLIPLQIGVKLINESFVNSRQVIVRDMVFDTYKVEQVFSFVT